MNILDYLILALLIWGFISGFRKGLVLQLALIAGIAFGIWLAMKFSDAAAEWIRKETELDGNWISHLGFILVFALVYLIAYAGGKALSATLSVMMLGLFNKIAGGAFGIVKMLLITSVFILVMRLFELHAGSPELEKESRIYDSLASLAEHFYPEKKKWFEKI